MATWLISRQPEKMMEDVSNFVSSSSNTRFSRYLSKARSFFAADLDDDVRGVIYETAMNDSVSQEVIIQTQARLSVARKKYLRFSVASLAILFVPHLIALVLSLFTSWGYLLISGHEIAGPSVKNALFFTEIAAVYFIAQRSSWRKVNGLASLADCLTRSLASGLAYQRDPANVDLRDSFAASIELSATRYASVFKRVSSNSSHLLAVRVRQRAKCCRNDILSLIPALVTADSDCVAEINRNLARLLIRSQLGYWYQTDDIVKRDAIMPLRDEMRISVTTFIKDRSIQVAFIALLAALAAAILPVVLSR
jgi:hypothetical protein